MGQDMWESYDRARSTPVTVEDIAAIGGFDDQLDRVWIRLMTRIDTCDVAVIAARPEGVRAFLATQMFENECGNGGLHQWFFNNPDPAMTQLVLDGYAFFGRTERRDLLTEVATPLAAQEAGWRETLRDGAIETFFDSCSDTELSALDEAFEPDGRPGLDYLRAHPEEFVG